MKELDEDHDLPFTLERSLMLESQSWCRNTLKEPSCLRRKLKFVPGLTELERDAPGSHYEGVLSYLLYFGLPQILRKALEQEMEVGLDVMAKLLDVYTSHQDIWENVLWNQLDRRKIVLLFFVSKPQTLPGDVIRLIKDFASHEETNLIRILDHQNVFPPLIRMMNHMNYQASCSIEGKNSIIIKKLNGILYEMSKSTQGKRALANYPC